jgi:ABC-2 type transport system ATP-binding protein
MAGDRDLVIETDGLTRRFGSKVAVDHLSLEVSRGEVFGFLGHNGAGKTTTVRLLNGVLAPSKGRSLVLGLDPATRGPDLRKRTGVLTETPSLNERLTARENLTFFADVWGVPEAEVRHRVQTLLATFDLEDRADDKVGAYSKGMKQRLALARALIHDPDLIFLDEPTAGLDPVASRRVHEMIEHLSTEQGRTVFLCTHNLVEAQQLCHRVAVLGQGRVLAIGTPEELGRQVGGAVRLQVEVEPGHEETAARIASARYGVSNVVRTGSVLALTGRGRASVPDLVSELVYAGVRVHRVEPDEPTLEDVYFALQESREGWA